MTAFCDNLREAKGFDNHVLVNKLGEMTKQSLIGRVPAVSKKRTGAIDLVLRDFRRVVEGVELYDIPTDAFAIVDWSNTGAGGEDGDKRTISFQLASNLSMIMDGEEDDEGRLIVSMGGVEFPPQEGKGLIPPGPGHALSEEEEEEVDEADDRLTQHPIGALFKSMLMVAMRNPALKFMGTNDRLEPTAWYFSRGTENPEWFAIRLDREELEEELNLIPQD